MTQQWLSSGSASKHIHKYLSYNFYYAIYRLKCILLAAPENSERSRKISEHLNTHTGKGYKPMQKVLQNSQPSKRSYVKTKHEIIDEKAPLEPLQLRAARG